MPPQRTILEGFGARTSTAPSPASATAAAAAASESRAAQAAARTRTDSGQTEAVDQTEPAKHAFTLEESWRGCTAESAARTLNPKTCNLKSESKNLQSFTMSCCALEILISHPFSSAKECGKKFKGWHKVQPTQC